MAQVARQTRDAVGQVNGVQHFTQAVALGRVELEEHGSPYVTFGPLVGLECKLQVFKHGELFKHRGLLELASNTKLGNFGFGIAQQIDSAAKEHGARVGPRFAGDDVHHGGFARTIGADDAAQLTRGNV
ncbi:hypothetical protein NIES3787_41540 [Microcystis aeruginosa NIES-3787]|uniref:Uncharacterized protein n=1 Tax=Microcystis aeruginosa NIES-3787 TaxID=2517782 RepID=A0A6H9GMV8_MICAE|nr:hypothetical protein NIES3787_41540 [Microcystis aeruginosa NIES-3787]